VLVDGIIRLKDYFEGDIFGKEKGLTGDVRNDCVDGFPGEFAFVRNFLKGQSGNDTVVVENEGESKSTGQIEPKLQITN
jgi:hypothetical protein